MSDRVDKEEEGSVVLLRLERGAESVFVGEWNMYLDNIVRFVLCLSCIQMYTLC